MGGCDAVCFEDHSAGRGYDGMTVIDSLSAWAVSFGMGVSDSALGCVVSVEQRTIHSE